MTEANEVVLKFSVESNGNVQNAVGSGEKTPGQCDPEKDNLLFRENRHNTETLSASTESLGVDNKGFSSEEMSARPRSADQIIPAIVDKVDCSVVVGKPCVVSSEPETGLSASQGHKTVRTRLKDPHLYKVTALIVYGCKQLQNCLDTLPKNGSPSKNALLNINGILKYISDPLPLSMLLLVTLNVIIKSVTTLSGGG